MICPGPIPRLRMQFLKTYLGATMASAGHVDRGACQVVSETIPLPMMDLHQHNLYSGRNDQQLMQHQEPMGGDLTVLLPAGKYYGLAARCGSNEAVHHLSSLYPDRFVFLPMRCRTWCWPVRPLSGISSWVLVALGNRSLN